MQYRYEYKYLLNIMEATVLAMRLKHIMPRDRFAGINGKYRVTSLYFDDLYDNAVYEKLSGIEHRAKYRIRHYNSLTDQLKLEKKTRDNSMSNKRSETLSPSLCKQLLEGKYQGLYDPEKLLHTEVYHKMRCGLRPKQVIEYEREAFVFAPGNVRITLDWDLSEDSNIHQFLSREKTGKLALANQIILEVKYDTFLPGFIQDALQGGINTRESISKYVIGRGYKN